MVPSHAQARYGSAGVAAAVASAQQLDRQGGESMFVWRRARRPEGGPSSKPMTNRNSAERSLAATPL